MDRRRLAAFAIGTSLMIIAIVALWRLPALVTLDAPSEKPISNSGFELFKLVLDKGVLALLVGAATFLFTRLVERHKAALAVQNELLREAREETAEEKRRHREQLDKIAEEERERSFVPRTQFDLECRFYGPEKDKIIADIRLIGENKGRTIRGIKKMTYRVAAFLEGEEPELYEARDGLRRLAIRGERQKWSTHGHFTYSIEPGIRQIFPLTTLVDARAIYVSVKVELETHDYGEVGATWQSEERFFPVVIHSGPIGLGRRVDAPH
ncbi:hypothetical protein [Sphingosinicella sp. BN140058]|uniref:hypothetical protein n=1 Tax=Sphingosinicella sp. BN140058 TaxID=1892855 RepID=UPI0010135A27|nr:hypothetical protein [Sphingosinicella sp. BN140058]QAY78149.1 hypothetical protein ETR14_17665 [Sphingosinicella sp. BN140058]